MARNNEQDFEAMRDNEEFNEAPRDPSHPDFSDDAITREVDGYNTRANQPDPAGELPLDPDGLTSANPDPKGHLTPSVAVALQDEELADAETESGEPLSLTRTQLVIRRFMRQKTAVVGLIGFLVIVLFAIVGPYIGKWDYTTVDNSAFLKPPSGEHWFGTGQTGRDLFALVIEGLRKSIVIGISVALIQTTVAAIVGASAAFFGKFYDKTILWIIDLLLVIPSFLLIAIISQKFGGTRGATWTLIFLLAAFGWMLTARVVRSMTLSVISLDYVRAAKYMSVPSFATITRHIIPNVSSFLIIDFTLGVVNAVMTETFLSYFGFGVQSPETSLGVLLADGQKVATSFPWVFLAPATVLTLMLVFINFMGDGLRDAIDPTSQSGGEA
ncbi:MAG: ABC transporter permease [Scrofimicrobium sp.]